MLHFVPKPERDFPEASNMQRALLELVIKASWMSRSADTSSLQATKLLVNGRNKIDKIPDGFWKQEVLGWEQESMAGLQIAVSKYAIGGDGADTEGQADDGWFMKPENESEMKLCAAQKMKKSGGFV